MVKRPLLVCGTVPAKQCTANGHWAHWAPFFSNEKVRNHHEINQQIVILMAFHGGLMGFYGGLIGSKKNSHLVMTNIAMDNPHFE